MMNLFLRAFRTGWFPALLASLALCVSVCAAAPDPSPAGLWKTVDDKTGRPRGFVRIYEQDGQLFGKIESSLSPEEAQKVCERCSGERKNKPVIGMVILTGMKKNSEGYGGGEILDPDTGWVYRCKMHLAENGKKLVLRGYLGLSLLGRSQTWLREY
jgi:uncharacterized protein (DUF2147 family)